jgi:phosphoglucosamine mutase
MVSASHNPADDNGLKVLDRAGLKLDDAIEDELEQLIWRTEELGSVPNGEIGRAVMDPGLLQRYRDHRLGLARGIDGGGLRIVLDCANGSGGMTGPGDPRRDRRDRRGHPQRARRREHQRRFGGDRAGVARPGGRRAGRRRRVRARRRRGSAASRSTRPAGSSTATSCWGSSRSTGCSRGVLPEGALVVSVLSNGGLQSAIEAAGGRVVRTPGRRQVHPRRDAGQRRRPRRREERARDRPRAHDVGRRDRHRPRGAAGDDPDRRADRRPRRRIPLLPQQQRAVKARHKDQWEGDFVLQRAIREAEQRLGGDGRVLVRPSGTEPALRVMIEGPDADLVVELADSIAALAGERLN